MVEVCLLKQGLNFVGFLWIKIFIIITFYIALDAIVVNVVVVSLFQLEMKRFTKKLIKSSFDDLKIVLKCNH